MTDEFVEPVALTIRGMRDGDAVVFFNFRPDRAREITRALADAAFDGFDAQAWPSVLFVCLTEYDPDIPAPVAFPKEFPENVLADVLADAGLAPVPYRRDREVRPRHFLPQRRSRGREGGGEPTAHRQPEGGHL